LRLEELITATQTVIAENNTGFTEESECSEAEANLREWAGLIQAPITRRS